MQHSVSENIKIQRKKMNLTQEKLAEAMGVTVGTVSKWENGNCVPDINMMMDLADFFGLSMDSLVGYEMSSKRVDAILASLHECRKLHKFEEGIIEGEKAIVRYPHNIDIIEQLAYFYYFEYMQKKDALYKDKSREFFNRAYEIARGIDKEKYREINYLKMIARLDDNPAKAVELLKSINTNGIFDVEIGEILAGINEHEESIIYYTKSLYSGIYEVLNALGHFLDPLTSKEEYKSAIDVSDFAIDLIKRVSKENESSYLAKDGADFCICRGIIYGCLGEKELLEKSIDEAVEFARKFDANPVFDIYTGTKFVYAIDDNNVAVAVDDRGNTSFESIQYLIDDFSKEFSGNKKIMQAVKQAQAYFNKYKTE